MLGLGLLFVLIVAWLLGVGLADAVDAVGVAVAGVDCLRIGFGLVMLLVLVASLRLFWFWVVVLGCV